MLSFCPLNPIASPSQELDHNRTQEDTHKNTLVRNSPKATRKEKGRKGDISRGLLTQLEPYICGPNQDFDLVVYLIIMFTPVPEVAVFLLELGLVGAREVGVDLAEDTGIFA